MRPIWKGSISFGLVYIPVAVYPATREEKISFRQLRSGDLSPIRYKKVAEADSKEVAADQIVKGFEYERGRYVVMKDEDFEKVRIESTHSIDITDFVDLEQVDPKFFYKPYFLEPQKGGEKAYAKQRQRCALISHEVIWNAMRLRIAFEKLNLIGFIAGSNRCGPLRRCSGSARSTLVVGSRDGRLSRFHVRLRNWGIRLSSFVQFVVELVLGFLKLLYRLAHSACEFRQFFRSEQNKNDQEDNDQVWPCQVHEAGEEAHFNWQHQTVSPSCKEFQRGGRPGG